MKSSSVFNLVMSEDRSETGASRATLSAVKSKIQPKVDLMTRSGKHLTKLTSQSTSINQLDPTSTKLSDLDFGLTMAERKEIADMQN